MKTQTRIGPFSGTHRFLSNFFDSPVTVFGRTWATAEHAYQAMKTPKRADQDRFLAPMTPGQAKRLGRKLPLRPDWEDAKEDVMTQVVRAKFQNPGLARRLLDTGDAELVELNTWMDQTWGVCNGKGENKLGKILMQVRAELQA